MTAFIRSSPSIFGCNCTTTAAARAEDVLVIHGLIVDSDFYRAFIFRFHFFLYRIISADRTNCYSKQMFNFHLRIIYLCMYASIVSTEMVCQKRPFEKRPTTKRLFMCSTDTIYTIHSVYCIVFLSRLRFIRRFVCGRAVVSPFSNTGIQREWLMPALFFRRKVTRC